MVLLLVVARALFLIQRPGARGLSLTATIIGVAGMLGVILLQSLLVLKVISFAQEIGPLMIATGVVGVWLFLVNYLGRRQGSLPSRLAWLGMAVGVAFVLEPVILFVAGGADWRAYMSNYLLHGRECYRLPGRVCGFPDLGDLAGTRIADDQCNRWSAAAAQPRCQSRCGLTGSCRIRLQHFEPIVFNKVQGGTHMKILFASMPADGHFNPLTGVAMHLKAAGHDVRWYAAPSYIAKLERLGIPYFPFVRATEINASNIGELFPERAKLRGPALIRFDGNHFFVANTDNYFQDVQDINASFPFDVLLCDAAFYAMQLVKEKLGKRVCAVGVGPSLETSKDVPPNFAGLKPAKNALGRLAHQGMRAMMERMVMSDLKANYNRHAGRSRARRPSKGRCSMSPIAAPTWCSRAACRALRTLGAIPTPR